MKMDTEKWRIERLVAAIDDLDGGNKTAFGRRLGYKDGGHVRQMCAGTRPITEKTVERIEAMPGMTGWFDMRSKSVVKAQVSDISSAPSAKEHSSAPAYNQLARGQSNVAPGPEIFGLRPLVSWVQAGNWGSIVGALTKEEAQDWRPSPVKSSGQAFFLEVRGESMENPVGEPTFSDGDLILVDPEVEAHNGSLVVVRLDDEQEATFKQLVIEGDRKYLKALNPSWPERIIQVNGSATICGVVINKVVSYR